MTLKEALEFATEVATRRKAGHVRMVKGRAGETDMATAIQVYRGVDLVALLYLPIDRDVMLHAAHVCAGGFGADTLVVTIETFGTSHPLSPLTGKAWEPGELQYLANEHDGRAKGWVSDMVGLQACNRAGDVAFRSLHYTVTGRTVTWGEVVDFSPEHDGELRGTIPEAMAQMMAEAPLDVLIHGTGLDPQAFGLDAERARAHTDCATVRAMLSMLDNIDIAIALVAEPGTVRHQVIKKSLPGATTIQP